jgi:hypothetical protein
MEGSKKVGYELKNIDYSNWLDHKSDYGTINAGLKELIGKGRIDDYKIVFRERPPDDMITWLNSRNIPWDYFVK